MITSCAVARLPDGSVKVTLDGVEIGAGDMVEIVMEPMTLSPTPTFHDSRGTKLYVRPEYPTVSVKWNGVMQPVDPDFRLIYVPDLVIEEDVL